MNDDWKGEGKVSCKNKEIEFKFQWFIIMGGKFLLEISVSWNKVT